MLLLPYRTHELEDRLHVGKQLAERVNVLYPSLRLTTKREQRKQRIALSCDGFQIKFSRVSIKNGDRQNVEGRMRERLEVLLEEGLRGFEVGIRIEIKLVECSSLKIQRHVRPRTALDEDRRLRFIAHDPLTTLRCS